MLVSVMSSVLFIIIRLTKAAKFYLDDDNVVRLYCFSEHRTYTSFDYLKLIKKC